MIRQAKTSPPPVHLDVPPGLVVPPDHSRQWFHRAQRALAGGISSSARATTCGDFPHPLYLTRGTGSRVFDADGNQFIDYLLGFGS
jgi:glutamate-1-semialdehyde 2,1-aminomutase